MPRINDLIASCQSTANIYIQTHNFPDHDAVATAFGLQQLFENMGISPRIVYDMDIQRDSLKNMIRDLNIRLFPADSCKIKAEDIIILVDGCKGNKNMTDLPGNEIAVIDHHHSKLPEDMPFSDIRPAYGACATIIFEYYRELNLKIPRDIATALMIGISQDTFFLTHGVSHKDLEAYSQCFEAADTDYVGSILRNNVEISDLSAYQYLLNKLDCQGNRGFCHFEEGCSQNLLGILANFVLSLNNIDFVVLCATNGDRVIFSLRSEIAELDAAEAVQWILRDIGFGGGHAEMAGGVIPDAKTFNKSTILARMDEFLKGAV